MIPACAVEAPTTATGRKLEELAREVERPLYRFLMALVRDANLALDCLQDALLRAHESVGAGRPVNRQWIFKVARNRAVDELRRRSRVRSDDDALARVSTADKADQALARLDPLDAHVLVRFVVEGYRTDEIGEQLGVSGAAVRQRLYRARERFRRIYEEAA
jgi:RNA polymerase sigma-70 factor (ECF subfamily)